MQAVATDASVPLFRPRVVLAESQLTLQQMQLRADWLRQRAFGEATHADIVVQGYRQPDGSLWRINQLVPVTSPALGLDQDLLVGRVEFGLAAHEGQVTKLRVAPIQAYTPNPGQVRIHKRHGGGGAPVWGGAGGIP